MAEFPQGQASSISFQILKSNLTLILTLLIVTFPVKICPNIDTRCLKQGRTVDLSGFDVHSVLNIECSLSIPLLTMRHEYYIPIFEGGKNSPLKDCWVKGQNTRQLKIF